MYKVASDKRQSGLHHGRLSDWTNGTEQLSAEDDFNQRLDGLRIIEERILASSGEERKKLGRQKLAMQSEMAAVRAKVGRERQAKQGIEHIFIEQAKAILPSVQMKIIWAAAEREFKRRQEAVSEDRMEA